MQLYHCFFVCLLPPLRAPPAWLEGAMLVAGDEETNIAAYTTHFNDSAPCVYAPARPTCYTAISGGIVTSAKIKRVKRHAVSPASQCLFYPSGAAPTPVSLLYRASRWRWRARACSGSWRHYNVKVFEERRRGCISLPAHCRDTVLGMDSGRGVLPAAVRVTLFHAFHTCHAGVGRPVPPPPHPSFAG